MGNSTKIEVVGGEQWELDPIIDPKTGQQMVYLAPGAQPGLFFNATRSTPVGSVKQVVVQFRELNHDGQPRVFEGQKVYAYRALYTFKDKTTGKKRLHEHRIAQYADEQTVRASVVVNGVAYDLYKSKGATFTTPEDVFEVLATAEKNAAAAEKSKQARDPAYVMDQLVKAQVAVLNQQAQSAQKGGANAR